MNYSTSLSLTEIKKLAETDPGAADAALRRLAEQSQEDETPLHTLDETWLADLNDPSFLDDVHAECATKSGTTKSGTTKSGTRWRHKSIIADGDFVNDLKADGFFAPLVPGVSPVVVAINLPPVSLPCSHPELFKPKRKPWRDRGEEVRGLFFHKALESEPGVKGFTLMLSRPIEALARAQGKGCLAWLHKRVVRKLKRLGGCHRGGAVPFWFAIEESRAGRLHIHGEISVGHVYGEKRTVRALRRVFAPIRKALKAAGGEWDADRDGEGTQLRLARGTPDFRWAGYCLKGVHKARPERRRWMRQYGSPSRWVAGYEGKSVTASEGLRRAAVAMHSAAVRF